MFLPYVYNFKMALLYNENGFLIGVSLILGQDAEAFSGFDESESSTRVVCGEKQIRPCIMAELCYDGSCIVNFTHGGRDIGRSTNSRTLRT